MAAVLERNEVGVRQFGTRGTIPDDPRARLMYYLDSMCAVLDLNSQGNIARLRNFRTYLYLTEDEIDTLVILCGLLAPSELDGKVIFQNEELCGDLNNEFFEVSSVKRNFVLTETIMIGGQTCQVRKVMFYKPVWLVINWILPMKAFESRLARIARGEPPQRRPAAVTYQNPRPAITYPTPSTPQRTGYVPPTRTYSQPPKAQTSCSCVIL